MKNIESKYTDETYFNGIKYFLKDFQLNYRAIIPFYVLFDPDLSSNEIRFYGLIEQMESSLPDVYITDRAIAYILNVSHKSKIVPRMFKKLKQKNYISREEREVKIGKRKYFLLCWNTVKGGIVLSKATTNTGVPEVHHQVENNTPGVPQVPRGVVPQVHRGVVPEVQPCKALEVKALKNNVCVGNPENTEPTKHTHTEASLKQKLTTNPECLDLFNLKFIDYKITIEELADNCIGHYESKNKKPNANQFLTWITKERQDNYNKKDIQLKQKQKPKHGLTGKQAEMGSSYNHALRLGVEATYFKDDATREQAKEYYEIMLKAQS